MDKKKLIIKIDEHKKFKQTLKTEVDDRIDELLGRVLSKLAGTAAKTAGGSRGGALASGLKDFKKNVIGTGDDWRFGWRKGYIGAGQKRAARRAARAGNVIPNPNFNPASAGEGEDQYRDKETGKTVHKHLAGQAAARAQARTMGDDQVRIGRAGLGDLFRMNLNPEKFKQDYQKRTGDEVPGFDVDAPGGPSQRYMDATTKLRYTRKAQQQAQAQRLSGDPETVQSFKDLATAKEKERGPFELHPSWGKDRTYFKSKQDQDTDPSYPYTQGTPSVEKETIRKGVEVPTLHGVGRPTRDVEYETERATGARDTGRAGTKRGGFWGGGINWAGRPISRGGKPWYMQGRSTVEPKDPIIIPKPPGEVGPARPPKPPRVINIPRELPGQSQLPPGELPQLPPGSTVKNPKTKGRDRYVDLVNTLRDWGGRKPGEASAEELGRRWKPGDAKRSRGHGRPGEKGYSRHGHQFSTRPPRQYKGLSWMIPGPRKDSSTIHTGSPLSEMLKRKLRYA